jgi:hypothetical protein
MEIMITRVRCALYCNVAEPLRVLNIPHSDLCFLPSGGSRTLRFKSHTFLESQRGVLTGATAQLESYTDLAAIRCPLPRRPNRNWFRDHLYLSTGATNGKISLLLSKQQCAMHSVSLERELASVLALWLR